MAKPRNYSAEYQRRITNGLARGLSRSQAYGNPHEGELPASIKNTPDIKRNWIATKIKEISIDLDLKDNEQRELYKRTVSDYQDWRRGGFNDKERHAVIEDIKQYMDIYNDQYDFDIGESPK